MILTTLALILASAADLSGATKFVPGNYKVILPGGPEANAIPHLPRKAGLASVVIIISSSHLVYEEISGRGSYLVTEPVAVLKQRFGYLGTGSTSEHGVKLTMFDAQGQRALVATGFVSVNEVNDAEVEGIVPRTKVIAIVLQGFVLPAIAGTLPPTMRVRLDPHGFEFLLRKNTR